jgi:trimeric autotransporter adhesin
MTTINTSIGGSFDATTITGTVITASTNFSGSGSGLTGIPIAALATLTANQVVVTDGSGVLTVTPTVSNTRGGTGADSSAYTGLAKVVAGVWSASALVNADVDPAAAIAFSKMASLTASQVAVTNGSGVITTSATLSNTLGGTGVNSSAYTGLAKVAAGAWTASTLVNADVDPAAAIAYTKLAALTATNVVITNGSGFITSATTLANTLGGIGVNSSAFTGVAKVAAGVWSASAIVNVDIGAAAAISFTKMAALTASQVAVTDGSGVISTTATLSTALGGTGQNFSAIGAGPFIATVSSGAFAATLTYATSPTANALVQMDGSNAISVGAATVTSLNTIAIATTADLTITSSGSGALNLGVMPLRFVPATIAGGATSTVARNVATTNATVTTLYTLATASNTVYSLYVLADWSVATTGVSASNSFLVKIKNVSGTVTVSGLANNTVIRDTGLNATSISVTASGTNALVQVTGLAATNMNWCASIQVVSQTF